SWYYTAKHTVTQADIDAGGNVSNTASVSTAQGAADSHTALALVEQRPSMTFHKVGVFADENGDSHSEVGEHINYTFTVTNTGNVTLHNIGISDANSNVVVTGGTIASLAPGASNTTAHATYAITQADIDAGFFDNTATATAGTASSSDSAHVILTAAPPP